MKSSAWKFIKRMVTVSLIFLLILQLVQFPAHAETGLRESDSSSGHNFSSKRVEAESAKLNKTATTQPEGSFLKKVDGVEIFKDVTAIDGTKLKIKRSSDLLNRFNENPNESGLITTDQQGNLLLNGDPLFVGHGDEKLPANLEKLMKSGEKKQRLTVKPRLFNQIASIFQPSNAKAASYLSLNYIGKVTYYGNTVGHFELNGEQVFCVFHRGATGGDGTQYTQFRPYDNEKIKRALYYGWGGEKNIFGSNFQKGTVVTSLILDRLYSGGTTGQNTPGYAELWDKVQHGHAPNTLVKFNNKNSLSVDTRVTGNVQRSDVITFNADKDNRIWFNLPSEVTLINDSTGKKDTGKVSVRGGNKFHLESSLSYGKTYNSGMLKGTLKEYQPLVSFSRSGNYQPLMYQYKGDPKHSASFQVNFEAQVGKLKIEHRDLHTNEILGTEEKQVRIGTSTKVYSLRDPDESGSNAISFDRNGVVYGPYTWATGWRLPSGKSGTGDSSTTVKITKTNQKLIFYYSTQWTLWTDRRDAHNGRLLDHIYDGKHWVDQWYDQGYQQMGSFDRDTDWSSGVTHYQYNGRTDGALRGNMPRGDRTIKIFYDPYQKIWKNHYDKISFRENDPNNPQDDNGWLWTDDAGYHKVGSTYDLWGRTDDYFSMFGHYFQLTDPTHMRGVVGYSDQTLKYFYDPYQWVTVHYNDFFTGESVNDSDRPFASPYHQLVKTGMKPAEAYREMIRNDDLHGYPGQAIYDLINKGNWNETVWYHDIQYDYNYALRVPLTVQHVDSRTGKILKTEQQEIHHQGDTFRISDYAHYRDQFLQDHADDTFPYRESRAPTVKGAENGKAFGRSEVTVTYYYDAPLINTGLKKLQIYTAPASRGLPVRVQIDKLINDDYTTTNDMDRSKVSVALYQGTKKLGQKIYTARSLPEKTVFKIPVTDLTVNTHKPYTVRLEGYNKNDIAIKPGARQLTTEGYTSSEDTVRLNLQSDMDHRGEQQRVVMTEVTPTAAQKSYYEYFEYGATPLPAKKSGYGVETQATLSYWSDLGADYQYGTPISDNTLTFQASQTLYRSSQDSTARMTYPVKNGKVYVPLQNHLDHEELSSATYQRSYSWIFPHVNVEKISGDLFSDQQVARHDSRIDHGLRDGGNKFYTPIWPDKKEDLPMNYPVSYESNEIGVNKVKVVMNDQLRIYAYMFGWMGSPTIKKDQILIIPVNERTPFLTGRPENITQEDVDWLMELKAKEKKK